MASRSLVLSLALLAALTIWVVVALVSFSSSRSVTHIALSRDIPHVSKCNLCESCEINPGQAHRRQREMLSFNLNGDGHQERPADPADLLTDEHLNMMFNEMKAKGHSDAFGLDLHKLEWDSLAAGIQAASAGLHLRTLLEYKDKEHEEIVDQEGDALDRIHALKFGGTPLEAKHKRIIPTMADIAAKKLLPNCTHCYGCTTSLNTLKPTVAFGKNFSEEQGASNEQDIGASNGKVMVKVWCMPIDKRINKVVNWACKRDRQEMRDNQFLLAQQSVVEECGLMHATSKVWIHSVDAIVPGYGVHIWWNGLWMEKADGISINQLSKSTKVELNKAQEVEVPLMYPLISHHSRTEQGTGGRGSPYVPADQPSQSKLNKAQEVEVELDKAQEVEVELNKAQEVEVPLMYPLISHHSLKLNKTQVAEVALMDLLTSQCYRHPQNVFVNEQGNIKVIDNLQALQYTWARCGVDSIFLPGTRRKEIVTFGNLQVNKVPKADVNAFREKVDPMVLLDYRCYVDGGEIGINYPPMLTKCLTKLASMSAEEVTQEYKFPMLRNGQALYGQPTNEDPRRYSWHPPCCSLNVSKRGFPRCGHEWNVTAEFPIGDPYTGKDWNRTYPDPGQFVGGTRFDW
eukprot:gene23697-9238_t